MNQQPNGARKTVRAVGILNGDGSSKLVSASRTTSGRSAKLLKGSKRSFRKPDTIAAFVEQLNYVATAVLNGEADIEVARSYSALARTIAQSLSAEMTKARIVKAPPSLKFNTEDLFE